MDGNGMDRPGGEILLVFRFFGEKIFPQLRGKRDARDEIIRAEKKMDRNAKLARGR